MELILVDKSNYKEAIDVQKRIFPDADGTINILASLDRELFIEQTGIYYIDDHIQYYLAKVDNDYVGMTGLYDYPFDKTSAWIGWYGILKEYRNKGLGTELLQKTMELARSKGFTNVRLYTDYVGDHDAVLLYEKMGFVGEKYTAEELAYDCRIYSISLTNDAVSLWNNQFLSLSHQYELDQMDEHQTHALLEKYDTLLIDKQ